MAQVAPERAASLIVGIMEAMAPAVRFPLMGRMVPEFAREELREILFQNYRIVYTVNADVVSVVAVMHAAMDVAGRLREMGEGA